MEIKNPRFDQLDDGTPVLKLTINGMEQALYRGGQKRYLQARAGQSLGFAGKFPRLFRLILHKRLLDSLNEEKLVLQSFDAWKVGSKTQMSNPYRIEELAEEYNRLIVIRDFLETAIAMTTERLTDIQAEVAMLKAEAQELKKEVASPDCNSQ